MRRQAIIRLSIICATVSLGALLYFFVDARYNNFLPHCPFNTLTGFYCPGCGSQRAISSLLHGDLLQAISFNVLLVMSLPVIGYSAYVNVYNTFGKQAIQQRLFYSNTFVFTVFGIVVIFWVLRNISMYPFTLLAPHQH